MKVKNDETCKNLLELLKISKETLEEVITHYFDTHPDLSIYDTGVIERFLEEEDLYNLTEDIVLESPINNWHIDSIAAEVELIILI